MNLDALEKALREKNVEQNEIDLHISYAKNLNMNNVPVIFDLEHFRQLLQIKKEDFVKIYYGIENHYHYKYIPKNKLKIKDKQYLSKFNKLKNKISDSVSKKIYTVSFDHRLKYKIHNKKILSYFYENTDYFRKLSLPSTKLKYIQRWILDNILYNIPVHNAAHGFVPSKSTITNACEHIGKEFIFKSDIKDFFPSISSKRVYGLFKSLGYNKSIAFTLTKFCTFQNELPQGAPTSPYISNLICRKMDHRIVELCKRHKLKYSRYADDITISGGRKLKSVLSLLKEIVSTEDFNINTEKTGVIHSSYKQKVTGVIVNRKASVPKELYRKLRQEIYYMKQYGIHSHLNRKNLNNQSNVKAYYYGLVNYCNMIDPKKGEKLYKELNQINWNPKK